MIPKIIFGMIVKNGMPWIKYSIKCVYQFAHEIIVVYDTRSSDGTIEFLEDLVSRGFNKVKIIKGTWDDKNNQCNEYAKIATGNWLWQLDADEVYHQYELEKAIRYLETAEKLAYCIPIINFFRDINTVVADGLWSEPPTRVFKFEFGDLYKSHRPPTLKKCNGTIIICNMKNKLIDLCIPNVSLYHYSHIGVKQMREKAAYYANNMKTHRIYSKYMEWYHNTYLNRAKTTKLHITGEGRCMPFTGEHPEVILEAIKRGELNDYLPPKIEY